MARIGDRIGTYEITRLLGSGGMAMVYAAKHTSIGTDHALKVLLPNYASNPRTVERFRQEARAQFRMRHANIVQVTDFVEDGENLALVMDLIHGMTLAEAIHQRPGPWPVDDVVAVMKPVLEAMTYAHREGLDGAAVVHRDLKPENVMLDLGGDRVWPGVPKVMDFGIAKVLGASNVATATNARMGTPGYMSPEQFKNAKDAGAPADVWALGVMLWQLLAGRLPVDPESSLALVKLYEGLTPVPTLSDLVSSVPAGLSEAVAQAMTLDPSQRFANAGPLLRAVELGIVRAFPSPLVAGLHERSAPVPTVRYAQARARSEHPSEFPTLTDPATGLVWAAVHSKSEFNWSEAVEFAQTLRGGGWRLPSKVELEAWLARHYLKRSGHQTTTLRECEWGWSSTAYPGTPATYWAVNSNGGSSGFAVRHRLKVLLVSEVASPAAVSAVAIGPGGVPAPEGRRQRAPASTGPEIGQLYDLAGELSIHERYAPAREHLTALAPREQVAALNGTGVALVTTNARTARFPSQMVLLTAVVMVWFAWGLMSGSGTPPASPSSTTQEAEKPAPDVPPVAEPSQGTAAAPRNYVVDASGETVKDLKTELVWQRDFSAYPMNWSVAKRYCGALTLAAGRWRLPTKDELLGLVGNVPTSAIDSGAFAVVDGGAASGNWFWSATPYQDGSNSAWGVNLVSGSPSGYIAVTVNLHARCVR